MNAYTCIPIKQHLTKFVYILLFYNYSVKISREKIISHLKILNDLRCIDFAGEGMKPAVDIMKDEVQTLCDLLSRHKDKLATNLREKQHSLLNLEPSLKKNVVSAAFSNSLKTVSLSDDEYHTVIDHAFTKKKPIRGRQSTFSLASTLPLLTSSVS